MGRIYSILAFIFISLLNAYPGVQGIGINYGLLGDNLPHPAHVISQLQQKNVTRIRIFEPYNDVLTALHDSGISVIVGVHNLDLKPLASDSCAAEKWVETNIVPHYSSVNITCISAGNEVYPEEKAKYIPGAMQNLLAALTAANISIPVSTVVSMQVLSTSYPPSQGVFSADAMPLMTEITKFLASTDSPLLVNVYTYFACADNPNIQLEKALLEDGVTAVVDGLLVYDNMFDFMVDAVYAALEKVGGSDVEIVVSETGWPSGGGRDASVENAQIYVNNLITHVSSGKGTPKRPGKDIDTYIFAMFNENLKAEGVEQHWGLHYPNLTDVYHVKGLSCRDKCQE